MCTCVNKMENYPELRKVISMLRFLGQDVNNDLKSNLAAIFVAATGILFMSMALFEAFKNSFEFEIIQDVSKSVTNVLLVSNLIKIKDRLKID